MYIQNARYTVRILAHFSIQQFNEGSDPIAVAELIETDCRLAKQTCFIENKNLGQQFDCYNDYLSYIQEKRGCLDSNNEFRIENQELIYHYCRVLSKTELNYYFCATSLRFSKVLQECTIDKLSSMSKQQIDLELDNCQRDFWTRADNKETYDKCAYEAIKQCVPDKK